jgi:O-antigen/teichoic acid export membrane protein
LADHDLAAGAPAGGLGSRALRNTVLVLSAKVVGRLIALVTVIAASKHLGDANYGTFTTLVNYCAIISVVLDLGFNVLYVREGARHPTAIQRYLRNVMSLRALMSVASLALLAIALRIAGLDFLLAPAFVLMVLTSYSSLLRNTLYAVQRLGFEALAVVLESLVLLGLVIYGIKTGRGVTYFVWAYAAQYAFSCVYFIGIIALQRIAVIGWRFEAALLRTWFWQGLPFALTFILTTLYFRIDQPIVFALRSHAEAGWYGLAYKPFEALLFVPMTLLSVVFPVLTVYHRDRPAALLDAVGRFYKALVVIGWPMTVGIFVLAHQLTRSLQLFDQSEPALRILALALVLGFANNAFIGVLSATDHQSSFTWAAGWSLVANVALNIALIPTFGYIGASWATVLTELVLGAVAWYLTTRHVGNVPVLRLSWRALLAGLLMGVCVYPLSNLGGVAIAIPIAAGVVAYAIACLLLRVVTVEEIDFARRALSWNR